MCPHLAASLRPINFHYAQRPAEPHTCANKKVLRHVGTSKTFRPPRHEGAGLRRSERPCTAAGPAGPFMELTWAYEFDGAAAVSEPSQLILRKPGGRDGIQLFIMGHSWIADRNMSVDISGPAYENRTMNSQATAIPRIWFDFMPRGTSVIPAQALGGVPSEAPSPGRKCRVDWFCINHRSIYPGIHLSIRLCR